MDDRREAKTRVRTGCITCRARRIKCDEAKPECRRCRTSNVECRGYDPKRSFESLLPDYHGQDVPHGPGDDSARSRGKLSPLHRQNGLPLVGLPSNPLPNQRPHDGARQILAYHQYIFRTVSVIAPPVHLSWWRDHLCEKAWSLEYLYNAIIALGTIHRAVLLLSGHRQSDQRHGQDTAIVAMQRYTTALEQLATLLDQDAADSTTVAAIILLAYFECFAGNVPAAYRHVRVAGRYLFSLFPAETAAEQQFVRPIATCLRALSRMCWIAVPLPGLGASLLDLQVDTSSAAPESPPPCTIHLCASCPCQTLDEAFDLGSSSSEIRNLIWNPLLASDSPVSAEAIIAFQVIVTNWMRDHGVPQLCPSTDIRISLSAEGTALDSLRVPPEPYATFSVDDSLIGALCEFYLAKIEWTLCLMTDDGVRHDFLAYSHCHRAMAWVETASRIIQSETSQHGIRSACERLNGGFLPVLYLLGQMSPRIEWLRWIIGQMKLIGQEGLADGAALAECLSVLPVFEMCSNSDISSLLDAFPSPTVRHLSTMVPDYQGHGNVAYYAIPAPVDAPRRENYGIQYYLSGSSRWISQAGDADSKPEFSFNNQRGEHGILLNGEWLRSREVAQGWLGENTEFGFSLDLALDDHRNGSLLRRVSNATGVNRTYAS